MFLAATRVNLDNFIADLTSGDPVAIGILAFIVLGTAFGAYQKYRSFAD